MDIDIALIQCAFYEIKKERVRIVFSLSLSLGIEREREKNPRFVFISTRHLYIRNVNNMMESNIEKVRMSIDDILEEEQTRLNINICVEYINIYFLR